MFRPSLVVDLSLQSFDVCDAGRVTAAGLGHIRALADVI
jgi:hypothetical protein